MPYLSKPEEFKTLYLDPGEDTGWCLANGPRLLSAGTEKMWFTADDLYLALSGPVGQEGGPLGCDTLAETFARKGVTGDDLALPIGRVVCEDFRIYPDKAKSLSWDPVRTARLIGAVTMLCRIFQVAFYLQPAAIKKTAEIGGAEELFYRPLDENRHQNDAIRHFVYFVNFGPTGHPEVVNRVSRDEASTKAKEASNDPDPAGRNT